MRIDRAAFNLLTRADASITAVTNSGLQRITSHGTRGRGVILADIADGVRFTVTNLFEGKLAYHVGRHL